MLKKEQLLLGIVTTKEHGNVWQEKIKQAKKLGLERVAVFFTCLEKNQRKQMYDLLKSTDIKEIPFAHIRGDMSCDEIDYLIEKYNLKVFNIHSPKEFPLYHDYSKYKHRLFVENATYVFDNNMDDFAGLCLDLSHLENDKRLHQDRYKRSLEMLKKYPVGCNHISAVPKKTHKDEHGKIVYSTHHFNDLLDFDYLKNYPREYFSDFIAMELENSLKEQIKVIDYILKLKI